MFELYLIIKYIMIFKFFNKMNNQTLKKVNGNNKKRIEVHPAQFC
jgi:hypothetical protein